MNRAGQNVQRNSTNSDSPLLAVDNLKVHFPFVRGGLLRSQAGWVRAVDGISLNIRPGETYALVGESGCGKSTTARAVVGLAPISAGEIRVAGQSVAGASGPARQQLRRTVQLIFQDPFASLNPRMTIGDIIGEPLKIHKIARRRERQLEIVRLLGMVGLDPRFMNRYPHEFSGGQRQRIGIARALAVRPQLLLCDEPVSALDVSIQAQVVNLLKELQQQLGVAYLFIAHDLGVVRHLANRVGVMYLGRIVEQGPVAEVYNNPLHPYTRALLSAIPIADPRQRDDRRRQILKGEVPSPDREYQGCPFADRCPIAEPACRETVPQLPDQPHGAACIKA